MKKVLLASCILFAVQAYSQPPQGDSAILIYRATATKINDLVHTKLDVKFDYNKSWMYGKAWITLHPHFYNTDSLQLDAKGMDIKEVALVKGGKNFPLKYTYDSSYLFITLDRTYKKNENYVIYINYISRPDELKTKGSAAITDAKGLYFINPKGEDKDKPTQIWTQGETEANSVWFPTIDKPNQKTTEEIVMTVPAKYVTLSNGILVTKKVNSDGTRTDTWKMDLPHSPYLFFMGVGDYAIIKDKYKNKEVSYYVEKEFAPVARRIFGLTPEMIAFYSRITGVDFPWPKYAQIVGRDYVSGAMENTTATLHGEAAQQDARQLADGNNWEQVIAHELFHQWFGDYVTTESWSNITLNESFADYSETLWNEYKYGKDEGDATITGNMDSYLSNPNNAKKDLVRFHYTDKEDVFDQVSYPKGGAILHMLRNYVGDSAFFASLHLYLTTHKFQNAEAQDLRLAFEQITGQDLNWFWNQWYYNNGHPKLDISYAFDSAANTQKVFIKQTQNTHLFSLPIAIDVYQGGSKKRYDVWVTNAADTFSFAVSGKPDLVNVDGKKILLAEKNEHKDLQEYIFQYNHAGLYRDRREAIQFASQKTSNNKAVNFLQSAINDKSWHLRMLALNTLGRQTDLIKKTIEPQLVKLAKTDSKAAIRAEAIYLLGMLKDSANKDLFLANTNDLSYTVSAAAIEALAKVDSLGAVNVVKSIASKPAKGELESVLITYADESRFNEIANRFENLKFSNAKFSMLQPFAAYLGKIKNTDNLKHGVDLLVKFHDQAPEAYRPSVDMYINTMLNTILAIKTKAGLSDQAEYIKANLLGNKK